MIGNDVLIRIAKELNVLYKKKIDELPCFINVISELHANENSNSRILKVLLQYSHEGEYPILESFISLLGTITKRKMNISVNLPELSNEESRIDLLVKEKKSYAIVIENKIWNAPEQSSQIERYIDYVEGLAIPKRKIYVIYLTLDGKKIVSDISLTDKAKRNLGYSNRDKGRFICVNYKYNILPWLEKLEKDEFVQNEPLLHSAIIQYVSFLKDKLNIREEDIIINNELGKQFMNTLHIEKLSEILQTWESVDKLQDIVSSTANNKIKSICENKICKVLEKKNYNIKSYDFRYDYFDLEVSIPEWKKCWWAMESDNMILFSGVWRAPEKTIAKKYLSKMEDVYENQDDNYIGWNWHEEYELNDDFWVNIEAHSTKFVNFIVNEIERVREATKEMKL